jgi:hypothetical protein
MRHEEAVLVLAFSVVSGIGVLNDAEVVEEWGHRGNR